MGILDEDDATINTKLARRDIDNMFCSPTVNEPETPYGCNPSIKSSKMIGKVQCKGIELGLGWEREKETVFESPPRRSREPAWWHTLPLPLLRPSRWDC